ncbi:hypothetical protein Agub_g6214, partial [Astrephomene gubernaculifera]
MTPPKSKKPRTGALSHVKLQAFADEPSDDEPDPVVLANELKDRGQAAAAEGRFSEARPLLGQAVRLLPGCAELHELHSQVLRELGSSWEAVRAAGRAVQLRPTWAEAHLALGRAQVNLGEPVLAEASYERALECWHAGGEQHPPEEPAAAAAPSPSAAAPPPSAASSSWDAVVVSELREVRVLAARQRALGPGVRAHVVAGGGEGVAGEGEGAVGQGAVGQGAAVKSVGGEEEGAAGPAAAGQGAAGPGVGVGSGGGGASESGMEAGGEEQG